MSTRSAIIAKNKSGQYLGIYCHYDGYLDHVGEILNSHYATEEKALALIALGDILSLCKNLSPPEGFPHSYDNPLDGVTVAYTRDRGEKWCEPIKGDDAVGVARKIGHDGFVYVFEDGKWSVNGMPLSETLAKDEALRKATKNENDSEDRDKAYGDFQNEIYQKSKKFHRGFTG